MRDCQNKPYAILNGFPQLNCEELDALLETEIKENNQKIIVLDDDPTGVQTVHDISVYTSWDIESIRAGFAEKNKLFYILTNSRSFTAEQTTKAHREIISNIIAVSKETGTGYIVISRSDSTMRGHFPLETKILKGEIEKAENDCIDGEILCPFFKEGGRFTFDNVHYVKYGDTLVPAGKTEFAQDKTFGYNSSDLRDYVEEKSNGEFRADSVICISVESLRALDFDGITANLLRAKDFCKIVVNAIDYCDIKVFCIALYRAMKQGKRFLFRTAASFVKEMGGISGRPLLTHDDLFQTESKNGGLIVVGSYTQKTTRQLEALLSLPNLRSLAFNSDLVLQGDEALEQEVQRTIKQIEEVIQSGQSIVVYTKRTLISFENDTKEEALLRSTKISNAVKTLVEKLTVMPRFIVAKGGITSSDIGMKALRVRCANVLGQIRPGVPVWQTGCESKFPKIPYVIFPGNVGEVDTLKEAVEILL